MSSSLAQKTAHLKWLRALRSARASVADKPTTKQDCDCKAWLSQQAKKQSIHKPRVLEAKPVELVLLASAAPKAQRDGQYNRRFEQGTADWYHIPVRSLQDYSDKQVQTVTYLAIGTTQAGVAERSATHLYAVASVQQLSRHMLTVEQSGRLVASEEPYWLFELSRSVVLAAPIIDFTRPFVAKLARANDLLHTHSFTALADVKENAHV